MPAKRNARDRKSRGVSDEPKKVASATPLNKEVDSDADPVRVLEVMLSNGDLPFSTWVNGLRDYAAKLRVTARLIRLINTGNLGDHRERISGAVSEMRIDYGPGYRIYYVQQGVVLILLLTGGIKDGQQNDIQEAARLWELCKDDVERLSRNFGGTDEGRDVQE